MNIGDRFDTAEEVKSKFAIFAYNNNFSVRVDRSETKKIFLKCADLSCKYIARFYLSRDYSETDRIVNNYKFTSGVFEHNCGCGDRVVINRKIRIKDIKREFQSIILNNISISVSTLTSLIREKTGAVFNYLQVYRIKESILSKYLFNFENCFRFINSLISYINIMSGLGIFERNNDNSFYRAFIGMPYSNKIMNYSRKIIFLDGCHIKNRYKNTLIMATTLDPNNNIIILAYSVVPIENLDNWHWFLSNLRVLMNFTSYEGFVFVSDRDKGLQNSLINVFPESQITVCLRHLMANLKKQCKNKDILTIFWKCALTFSEVKFSGFIRILQGHKPFFNLIKDFIPQWARSYMKFPRFNHFTSNVAESCNNAINKHRNCSDLDLIVNIYNYINDQFSLRKLKADRATTKYSSFCTKQLQKNLDLTDNYNYRNIKEFEGVITTKKRKENGLEREYYVNLKEGYCSCGHFQDNLMPCFHATKLISVLGIDSSPFISDYYKTEVWRHLYSFTMTPLLKKELIDDLITIPPNIVRKKGRPKSGKRRKAYTELITKK